MGGYQRNTGNEKMNDVTTDSPKTLLPLSGGAMDLLKIIAFVFLLMDTVNMAWQDAAPSYLSLVGRVSFPIAAYCLACHMMRGFNLKKYIILLTVLGLATWPMTHLAVQDMYMNVLLTLAAGAAFMWAAEHMTDTVRNRMIVAACLLMALPQVNDYGVAGVVLPAAILAVLRGRPKSRRVLLLTLAFISLSGFGAVIGASDTVTGGILKVIGMGIGLVIIGGLIPWALIRGCRRAIGDRARFLPKYLMHVLYPLHVLVIWFVK
jgi:hypothetical protein